MEKILVSACLLGRPVRYNGTDKRSGAEVVLRRWQDEGRLLSVCPEVAVGFPIPRPAAEIVGPNAGGADVLAGRASVVEATGADVTALYEKAARDTVSLAIRHGCRHAILTDGSPSCGSTYVYDGTFSGRRISGDGTTTAALRAAGVQVWSETQIAALDEELRIASNRRAQTL